MKSSPRHRAVLWLHMGMGVGIAARIVCVAVRMLASVVRRDPAIEAEFSRAHVFTDAGSQTPASSKSSYLSTRSRARVRMKGLVVNTDAGVDLDETHVGTGEGVQMWARARGGTSSREADSSHAPSQHQYQRSIYECY